MISINDSRPLDERAINIMSSAKKIELMMMEERVIPSPDLLSSAPKLDTKIANSSGDKLQPVNYDFKINI